MTLRSETALKKAIEMEREGKQFYLESASSVNSLLARRVFEELAREEDCHIAMIEKIYKQITENNKPLSEWITSTGSLAGDLEKVFRGSLKKEAKTSGDDLSALRFGLEREEKSILYYEALALKTKSKFEKRFFLTLSYEERGHYLKIMDAIEFITDPAGWYYVKERDMVDGG
jgi:rubrerythrin